MMNNWREMTLSELYEFSSGLSKPKSEFGSGYPFLSFKDVFYNSAVPETLTEKVQSSDHERNRCSIQRGDVFLTRTSETIDELGMSCVALKDIKNATFNGFSKRLRPKTSGVVHPEFSRYAFRSKIFRDSVTSMTSMSTRASLNNEMLGRLKIKLPSYQHQVKIGSILTSLDDKIELNRKTNETLEAMARTLFQAWFVDFEPVRAKMEGRWKRGQSLPGLPAHLYDLFPDRLVESEQGEIPKGWRISKIGDEVSVCGGGTPSTKEPSFWQDGTHCWATPKDLSSLKTPILMDTDRKITDKGLAKISSGLLPEGTVLLSSRAPIGYLAITETQTAINQGFIAMICSGTINNLYTLFWCQANMEAIVGRANGSTFQEISKSSFREIPIITPSSSALDCYQAMIRPLYSQLVKNEKESCFLAQLRDTLLPRLMSGELRIPDAERIAQKAL